MPMRRRYHEVNKYVHCTEPGCKFSVKGGRYANSAMAAHRRFRHKVVPTVGTEPALPQISRIVRAVEYIESLSSEDYAIVRFILARGVR